MGFSFELSKEYENKEYEYKGTVTIGTNEYKDLIKENVEVKYKAQNEHDDWYKERCRANSLESKLNDLNEWLDSDDTLRPKFKLWKMRKMAKESEEA